LFTSLYQKGLTIVTHWHEKKLKNIVYHWFNDV